MTLKTRSKLLQEGVSKNKENICVKVNYLIDQWRQGKIMDNEFCKMVENTKLQILFSKATGYPICKLGYEYQDKADNLMINLVTHVLQQIKDLETKLSYDLTLKLNHYVDRVIDYDKAPSVADSELRVDTTNNDSVINDGESNLTQSVLQDLLGVPEPDYFGMLLTVTDIVFSSNEKFALLFTKYHATLIKIEAANRVNLAKIEFKKTQIDSKWVAAVSNDGKRAVLQSTNFFQYRQTESSIGRTERHDRKMTSKLHIQN